MWIALQDDCYFGLLPTGPRSDGTIPPAGHHVMGSHYALHVPRGYGLIFSTMNTWHFGTGAKPMRMMITVTTSHDQGGAGSHGT